MLLTYIIGVIVMGVLIVIGNLTNKEDEEEKCTIWELILGSVLWFMFPLWLIFVKMMSKKLD